jgi:hypothetical protein
MKPAKSPTASTHSSASPKPFNVSCDHLLLDDATHHPLTPADTAIAELNPDDLDLITRFIDALVTKTRLRNLTATIS